MRSCAACFFFRKNPENFDEGECMNRPPHVQMIPGTSTSISVRPVVGAEDYCAFFGHRSEKGVTTRDKRILENRSQV